MLPNVVIVGAPKSGTTSLHLWLTAHPDVSGPTCKETGYFVDDNSHAYNPNANFRIHGVVGYENYFENIAATDARIVLEVAPDYMYQQTAIDSLPLIPSRPRILFVLREPAAQIYSLFNYLKNNWQYVPQDMSFPRFVDLARQASPNLAHHELLQHAIANAHYCEHIDRWIAHAGADRVGVYLFEDLVADSRTFMQRLCIDLDIDPSFYDRYDFPKGNETYRARSSVFQAVNIALRKKIPNGRVYERLRRAYRKLNTRDGAIEKSADELRVINQLRDEFSDSNQALAKRFNLDLHSWRHDRI